MFWKLVITAPIAPLGFTIVASSLLGTLAYNYIVEHQIANERQRHALRF